MAEKACFDYRELPPDEEFSHGTKYGVSDVVDSENQRYSIIRFAPGEAGPLSYHADPVEEYYFVVEGTFRIQLDDEEYVAEPGTVAFIPPGVAHKPSNETDEPAVLLVVQTPQAENTTYVDE